MNFLPTVEFCGKGDRPTNQLKLECRANHNHKDTTAMTTEIKTQETQDINPKTGLPYKSTKASRERAAKWFIENRERAIKNNKDSYQRNKSARKEVGKKWVENNREKSNAIKAAWKERHREKYLKQQRTYAHGRIEKTRKNRDSLIIN